MAEHVRMREVRELCLVHVEDDEPGAFLSET